MSEWPIHTPVVVRSSGSWANGRTGVVIAHPHGDWCTVQLDGPEGHPRERFLALDDELRTIALVRGGTVTA